MHRTLILKRFKEIGLKPSEAKTYLSLLEKDTLTVSEVSRIAGIPRPNAYQALEELMSKGLCISKPGDTKKYSASDPALLVEKFHMQADEAAERELQNLTEKEKLILDRSNVAKENITNLMKELRPQYETSREKTNPMEYIEIIKDPYQIHKRFMQLVGEAKEEILVFTKPPFSRPREKRDEHLDQETEVLKRGIRGRCIYEIPTDEDEGRWLCEHIKGAVRAGEEARVLKDVPMKMAILDSRIVLFALADPVSKEPSLTSQIVEHRDLARSLKILFDSLWEKAQDYHVLNALGR
jgi:sugar-specific transcriptional regulator TrmB